ncbi:MAG: SLBB domain-containing protein, partial [Alphaproteobacteria bacterium]|nr:SLBB domain-containing protein [Alphaproteobacteria bacterium]
RMLLEAELQKLNASPAVNTDGLSIVLRRGAGAYICGEESAMLESIEGKRGLPRHKPPFPAQVGLFGMPTLINNVETLYFVTEILRNGAAWFKDTVRHERHGFRHYSVSGRVRNPGVVLAEAGTTLDELINTHCGGMEEGHTLKGFLPGGASGGIFPASLADVPLDFDMFQPHGGFIGSAAVVVFSEQDSMADVALNLMKFFRHESCGQCTPCRVGTDKMVQLLEQKLAGSATAQSLTSVMLDASICGLGQAAPNPVTLALKHFPADMSPSS